MKAGTTVNLTGVSMDGIEPIHTYMPIMLLQDTEDIMALIRGTSMEYCRTRQGLAEYDGNGRNFDLADFWYQVPQALCIKHGFKKLDDGGQSMEQDADEPLFQLSDLMPTKNILEDVCNELAAGPVGELKDMLYCTGYEGDMSFLDHGISDAAANTIRSALESAMQDGGAREEVLSYWMDHCASIYADCSDGAEGVTE